MATFDHCERRAGHVSFLYFGCTKAFTGNFLGGTWWLSVFSQKNHVRTILQAFLFLQPDGRRTLLLRGLGMPRDSPVNFCAFWVYKWAHRQCFGWEMYSECFFVKKITFGPFCGHFCICSRSGGGRGIGSQNGNMAIQKAEMWFFSRKNHQVSIFHPKQSLWTTLYSQNSRKLACLYFGIGCWNGCFAELAAQALYYCPHFVRDSAWSIQGIQFHYAIHQMWFLSQ